MEPVDPTKISPKQAQEELPKKFGNGDNIHVKFPADGEAPPIVKPMERPGKRKETIQWDIVDQSKNLKAVEIEFKDKLKHHFFKNSKQPWRTTVNFNDQHKARIEGEVPDYPYPLPKKEDAKYTVRGMPTGQELDPIIVTPEP